MKNKIALENLDKLIRSYNDFSLSRYNKLGHRKFSKIYGKWDVETFYGIRNTFFTLVTGEPDFDKFYSRFDCPAVNKGNPIAWGPRFLPDLMNDEFFSSEDISKRAKEVRRLYNKCKKLEKSFKRE